MLSHCRVERCYLWCLGENIKTLKVGEIANGFVEKTTIKRHYYFQINELNFFPELHEQHSSTIKKHRLRYGIRDSFNGKM